jgi:TRAP-type C4-dicarboxylate transport system permease small subunit
MKTLCKHFEEIVGSLLLVAVALITLFNVLSRYLFSHPLSWAEEVATYLFVWMAMIGAALAVKTRQHFVIEFVIDRIPGAAGALARVCVAALVVAASGVVLGTGLLYMSWGWNAVTPATEMSRAIPYGAVAAGGGLMLIRSFGLLVKEITGMKQGAAAEVEDAS